MSETEGPSPDAGDGLPAEPPIGQEQACTMPERALVYDLPGHLAGLASVWRAQAVPLAGSPLGTILEGCAAQVEQLLAAAEASVGWETAEVGSQIDLAMAETSPLSPRSCPSGTGPPKASSELPAEPSGGPESSSGPPMLPGAEGATREAPLGGPVPEGHERGDNGDLLMSLAFEADQDAFRDSDAVDCALCPGLTPCDQAENGGYCPASGTGLAEEGDLDG